MIFDVYLKFTYVLFVSDLQVQNPTNITNANYYIIANTPSCKNLEDEYTYLCSF